MKIRLMLLLLSVSAGSAFAACCLGDGCTNTLGEYQDAQGNPTGKYSLLDASGTKIQLKTGDSCTCAGTVGTDWPPKNCPSCSSLVCPKCGHDIFQHSCDAKGTPGAGMKALK